MVLAIRVIQIESLEYILTTIQFKEIFFKQIIFPCLFFSDMFEMVQSVYEKMKASSEKPSNI
jgi:hypothetical protein